MSSVQYVQQYKDLKVIKVVFQDRWCCLDDNTPLDSEYWVITAIEPFDWRFHYLAYCAWLTTSWLCTKQSVRIMASIAYKANKRNIEMNQPLKFPDEWDKAREWVETVYLKEITDSFPAVFLDDQIKSETTIYGNHRREWDDTQYHQRCNVYIAGYQVDGLMNCLADKDHELTRRWLLRISATLLHEVGGHVLVSKVQEGRDSTPELFTAYHDTAKAEIDLPKNKKTVPISESGEVLELGVLGGVLNWESVDVLPKHHPGLPKLHRENGEHVELESPQIKDVDIAKILNREFTIISKLFETGTNFPIGGSYLGSPGSSHSSHSSHSTHSSHSCTGSSSPEQPQHNAKPSMPLWVHETHPVPVRVDEGANIHKVPFEWEIKVDVIGPPVRQTVRSTNTRTGQSTEWESSNVREDLKKRAQAQRAGSKGA